jgi:hypothetical protein
MTRGKMICKAALALLFVFCVVSLTSCKKAETEKVDTDGAVVKSAEKAVETVEAKCDAKLVAIPLVLPKPMFVGTPGNIQNVPNLEKPLGKARPDFLSPEGTVNVAIKKTVMSSDDMPIIGELEMITDGDKEASDGSYVELAPFKQNVTIDLGAEHEIFAVVVWHYHKESRVYLNQVVQTASDADFVTNVNTIFNNDGDNVQGLGAGSDMNYVETAEGKLIDAKGVKGRYVRLHSNGNNSNELNHYIEVEVYGKAVK